MRRIGFLLLGMALVPSFSHAAAESRIQQVGEQRVLFARGTPFEIGKAHGRLLADEVGPSVRWLLDETARAYGLDRAKLGARRDEQKPRWPASFVEEVKGLAEGSGVPIEEIELAQVVPIRCLGVGAIVFGKRTVGGKLLHLARLEPAQPHPATSESRANNVPPVVLLVRRSLSDKSSVTLTWPGYLGCLAGVNEKGISLSVLGVDGDQAAGGTAAPIAMAEAILRAETRSEIEQAMEKGPLDPSLILAADGKLPDARAYEVTGKETRTFGPGDSAEERAPYFAISQCIRRSNFYLDSGLAAAAAGTATAPAPMGRLFTALSEKARALAQPASTAEVASWADLEPAAGGFQALFSPSDMSMFVRVAAAGGSSPGAWQRYQLRPMFAAAAKEEFLAGDSLPDPATERLQKGTVRPAPRPNEKDVPKLYQLGTAAFTYELEPEKVVQGIVRTKLRFPSPVKTPHPENNTVHAEVFRPFGTGPFPGVIVLHIAGGDFELSRFIANALAQKGIATVFVMMPYYGDRRPPGKKIRMLEPDVEIASEAMRQVVLDLRRLCDWMQAQGDFDPKKLGIIGVSLGSITGALSAAIEPRLSHACLIMGGAKLAEVIYGSVEGEARDYRRLWAEHGGTKEKLAEMVAAYDPWTYRDRLRQRVVLMISATEDTSIPRASSDALWEATGRQQIIWYPCGHYTMVRHLVPALHHAVKFFIEWSGPKPNSVTYAK